MKKNNYYLTLLLIATVKLISCEKNDTKGYPDPEDPGIAIFSNTGNNILSCYMDNKPWRTIDRRTPVLSGGPLYEVLIHKHLGTGISDTLEFLWSGYFTPNAGNAGTLLFRFAVPKNFSYKNFFTFNAQRIIVNGNNGYFTTDINLANNSKGTGTIYFHTALIDSVGPGMYVGKMSGIFEANLPAFKITKGRFDHTIVSAQINF